MVPKNNNNKHSKYNQSSATNGCIIWHSDIIVVTDLKQSFQLALIPNVLFTVQHKCVYGEGSLCRHTWQHDYIRINLSQRKSSVCQASGFTWGRSAKSQLWHLTSTGLLFTLMGSTHLFPINLKRDPCIAWPLGSPFSWPRQPYLSFTSLFSGLESLCPQ